MIHAKDALPPHERANRLSAAAAAVTESYNERERMSSCCNACGACRSALNVLQSVCNAKCQDYTKYHNGHIAVGI